MMERITAADGHVLDCWTERPEGAAGGVVILQEIFGITDQLKGVAARYAREGWAVAVPALFDRAGPGQVIPFDQAERGRDLMMACDPAAVMRDVAAAVEALRPGPVAVIGFCWGGGLAIAAAQELDIAAAVSFYGTRLDRYMGADLRAPVQGHWGSEDSHAAPEILAALRARFPEMEVHVYKGAGHAFANEARPAVYRAEDAERAHARATAFLRKHL